jgi:transposase
VTRATIPAEVRAHSIGPKLTATLTYLSGRHHLSKRGIEEVAETVFDVPVALGTISKLEQEMSQALAAAHAEVAEAVRQAAAKNVDETSWKQAGKLCWLWTAVTGVAVLFVIHAKRSARGLTMLLGEAIQGVISSDRWSVYGKVPLERRQICWAHLRRDFQAIAERGGSAGQLGAELLAHAEALFNLWYKVRDGTRGRRWLQRLLEELRPEVVALLERGTRSRCAKTAGTCREILEVEAALWTFAQVEGVEPTNNAAERALRPAVLWRKRSFGCWSEDGCRFVERLLSVLHTLRAQKRRVLGYLTEAVMAHRAGLPTPQLLTGG